jgi:hypothetical protein
MTRTAVRTLLLLAALGAALAPLGALEVSNGQVKLTLHEGIGRFSVAGLARSSGGSYTPLLVAQDPRTSMVSLLVADRVIRLGESSDFRETAEKTTTGARFTWTSKQLVVTETFSFIGEPGADSASGVRVDLEVKNVSTRDVTVGVRYLFDTWLGEASAVHFRTDTVSGLTREMTVSGADRPAYWVSPLADDPDGFGFQCMLSGEGVTVPDRIVFANWKRLSDAPWSYTTSATRTFSQAPYSLNDSAVGQYYDAQPLARAATITVTLALGRASPSGLTLKTATSTLVSTETATTTETTTTETVTEVTEATATETVEATETTEETTTEAAVEETTPVATVATALEDLTQVNSLLGEIERLLAVGPDMSAEDLDALEQAIVALKERVALYGSGR